ncbi:LysR family transcriptional regulator [Singulisphaera acidiphila]|uniref:Transcriptional regulator n=1 Tax=Singulisphaera acidiphila (strain ATCC BAA-1392 / DSM 18658 / VKM B-2454 / MOB10) TaxID=886293 RepID=L0DJM1_SINAD|nr:LysR family transcriptional regulator [Singulisphaera acidiphila]AGA29028.1 transcriptional regulator [Singulisphaera acidiphila DSM 18658]
MQLESIKIFCDVVRWASFSRGAAENQISQSSASQVVHQLELRLGVKLIDRSKRPWVLTPHGKVYYEGCKELVGRYLEIENRVKALEDDHNLVGTVRLASIYSIGLHHMSQYVRTFGDLYPGANVQLEYLHPTRVVESVLAEEVELGLISFPRKWTDLTVIPWREEAMVLAVHPSHRFARLGQVSVADLDGETFVGFDADLAIRRAIDRFLRHHNVQVRVAVEFDNIENIKRAVEMPAGVAILPEPTLAREVKAGSLSAVRIDGQDPSHRLTRPLAIIRRRSHQLSLTASRFLKLLTAAEENVPATAGAGTGVSQAEHVDAKP